jgi:hypothetical protein
MQASRIAHTIGDFFESTLPMGVRVFVSPADGMNGLLGAQRRSLGNR